MYRIASYLVAAALLPTSGEAGTLALDLLRKDRIVIAMEADGGGKGYALSLVGGRIDIYDPATGAFETTPFLDGIGDAAQAFDIAFAPDYATSGDVYVSYRTTEKLHKVVRLKRSSDGTLDPASATTIVSVAHDDNSSTGTHYGGAIDFGPDGMLYVTTGDSDGPFRNVLSVSQRVDDPRGAVLRIDPDGGIPSDNPDFGADAVPGLWATGLRNPFKAAFDPETGRYFIADVGEDLVEEINLGVAGANYGWSAREGAMVAPGLAGAGDLTDPFYAYDHGISPLEGYSVTGGFVYRGAIAELDGQYVFGDFGGFGTPAFTGDRIWSFAADGDGSDVMSWQLDFGSDPALDRIVSFGSDGSGGLVVGDFAGSLYRVTVAPIPLPAGALLLITAMAAFGAAARRRA